MKISLLFTYIYRSSSHYYTYNYLTTPSYPSACIVLFRRKEIQHQVRTARCMQEILSQYLQLSCSYRFVCFIFNYFFFLEFSFFISTSLFLTGFAQNLLFWASTLLIFFFCTTPFVESRLLIFRYAREGKWPKKEYPHAHVSIWLSHHA